nr:GntR family transcriptional regulator [uncultured Mediterraneibacter sp.]
MITIDYQSKLPLYEQIAERFQSLILGGALTSGSQMPSVRSLAIDLSINPNTIQKAFSLLEQQGFIYPVKGRGSFVSDTEELARKKKLSLLKEMKELLEKGKMIGITRSEYLSVIEELYQKEDKND